MSIVMISEPLLKKTTAKDGRILRDRVLSGFGVRLNAHKRTLLIATSVSDKQSRMMLGYWPLMSVEKARTKALKVSRECRAGRQPSNTVPQSLPTLLEALDAYCTTKSINPSSRKRYGSLMQTHFGNSLRKFNVSHRVLVIDLDYHEPNLGTGLCQSKHFGVRNPIVHRHG